MKVTENIVYRNLKKKHDQLEAMLAYKSDLLEDANRNSQENYERWLYTQKICSEEMVKNDKLKEVNAALLALVICSVVVIASFIVRDILL